ncbi:hypothetical protein AGLY_004150 [Aphis glycines]|uniref:Uncharacterized protein n=1 Tax=Aphis glycines TaxID=307491 RepID=A0A6G0TXE6_APHGL|nr:hypothetical protein AGLY_004150 [Aphis glycines]
MLLYLFSPSPNFFPSRLNYNISSMNFLCSFNWFLVSCSLSGNGPMNLNFISASDNHSNTRSALLAFDIRSLPVCRTLIKLFTLCCSTKAITVSKSPCTGPSSVNLFSVLRNQSKRASIASLNCPQYNKASSNFLCLSTDLVHTKFHFSFNSLIILFKGCSSLLGAFSFNALPILIVESYVACFPLKARCTSLCLAKRCLIRSGSLPTLASWVNSSRFFSAVANQSIRLDHASLNSRASL